MIPTFYHTVGGTSHGIDNDLNDFMWWELGSKFTSYLKTQNLILHPASPFEWDGIVGGTPLDRKLNVWRAAGAHFKCQLLMSLFHESNVIAHSHGGNVVLCAAARGARIRNLITVSTPVRRDMEKIILQARGNIDNWLHVYDSRTDYVAVLGTLFDRRIRIVHRMDMADRNDDVKQFRTGHSGMFEEQHFSLWKDRGWAAFLAYGRIADAAIV